MARTAAIPGRAENPGDAFPLIEQVSHIAIAAPELTVDVIGEPRVAQVLREPAYDPNGMRLRS